MEPLRVKVLGKGQIVIPATLRKQYRLLPGSEIDIFPYDDFLYLIPLAEDPIAEAMGCLPPKPSLAEELLKQRRRDFAE